MCRAGGPAASGADMSARLFHDTGGRNGGQTCVAGWNPVEIFQEIGLRL